MIPGIVGKKLGMSQIFTEDGRAEPVTAVQAGPCAVIQVKTIDTDGYNAVQLGFGEAKRLKSPEKGHLKDNGNFRHLREFRVDDVESVLKFGTEDSLDRADHPRARSSLSTSSRSEQ